MEGKEKRLVIVTGLSGAGKTVALRALEDLTFYCVDNVPVELFSSLVEDFVLTPASPDQVAIGMDLRHRSFTQNFLGLKAKYAASLKIETLFLTAGVDSIVQRYSTTRRKHPLLDEGGALTAAIKRESDYLKEIEKVADYRLDTSTWTPHFLARMVEEHFGLSGQVRNLYVSIVSFGFKYGLMQEADSVFDVRFLQNPHFDLDLRPLTGLDPRIQKYVLDDPKSKEFIDKLVGLHKFLLPAYYSEGKHYFRIGIGCTGGKHRSVVMAEELAANLAQQAFNKILFSVGHRDLEAAYKPNF